MLSAGDVAELHEQGLCILRGRISPSWQDRLRAGLKQAFDAHRAIQVKNHNDIDTGGVALHVLLSDPVYIAFLDELFRLGLFDDLREHFFKSNFILNSFSALESLPNQPNFSTSVHRDTRFFTGPLALMLNMLVMLDDFTDENGATLLLPGSHKREEKPTDEQFHQHAIKALGRSGDILLFNSNVWHAGSVNTTQHSRRALPLTFTKSMLKQLLDYPRALGYDKREQFDERMQQLLGYHARVPASLDEWYQPLERRFYKKDQD